MSHSIFLIYAGYAMALFICSAVKKRIPYLTGCGSYRAFYALVRVMGLEPIRLSTHAPQTCLSAYSSTLASQFRDCFNIISEMEEVVKLFFKKKSAFILLI